MAILIAAAATLAGLIAENAEAVEPYGANTNPSIERPLLGKSGPGPRARANARRNVKGSGSFMIPGADGFVSSRNYKPYQKPLSARRPGEIRQNPKLVKEFNGLEQKLRNANMKAGRGVKALSNSNGIYYARGYTEGARLYFKYSGDNIIILGESNKPTQDAVIEFLLKNY